MPIFIFYDFMMAYYIVVAMVAYMFLLMEELILQI